VKYLATVLSSSLIWLSITACNASHHEGEAPAAEVEASKVEPFTLEGSYIQGGMVRGRVAAGSKVSIGDKEILVDAEGRFIFGFGRDNAETASLTMELPGGERHTKVLAIEARTYDTSYVEGIAPKYVEPPAEVLARIKQEGAEKWVARNKLSPSEGFGEDFAWPLTGRISGVYGSQRFYNGTPKRPHFGVDVAAPTGTYFYAPAGGVVTLSDDDMYYEGGLIFLDHGMGLVSAFLHLSGVDVKVGDVVQKGDVLGRVGAAGRANGPHLDWRMYWTDQRLDPALLVGPMPATTEED
jgi:murein DD-endopeptidase MepM/ murein hydrolase activator NlpD